MRWIFVELQVHIQRDIINVGRHGRHAAPRQVGRIDRVVDVEAANDDEAVAAVGARAKIRDGDPGSSRAISARFVTPAFSSAEPLTIDML